MTKETCIEWLQAQVRKRESIPVEELMKLLQSAKVIEQRYRMEESLEAYKQGWREANAELEKYVEKVMESHLSLKNQ